MPVLCPPNGRRHERACSSAARPDHGPIRADDFAGGFGVKPAQRTYTYIDRRDEDERNDDQRARHPLDGDLEQIAATVGQLGHDYQQMGDDNWNEMKAIGERLNERGGFGLLRLVCLRAKHLGGRHTSVSRAWDGIGEWRD